MSERARPFEGVPASVLWLAGSICVAHVLMQFAPDMLRRLVLFDLAVNPARYQMGAGEGGFAGPWDAFAPLAGHVFLHSGWLHLFFNMVMLLQAGPLTVEGLGADRPLRLWALFFLSAVGGALCYIWINPGSPNPAVGASGAVSGMFAAYLWAALQVGPATAAMRRAILLTGAGFLVVNVGLAAAARIAGVFPIAWEAHLGGFVAGLILYPVLARR